MLLIIGLVLIFHNAPSAACVSVKSQHKGTYSIITWTRTVTIAWPVVIFVFLIIRSSGCTYFRDKHSWIPGWTRPSNWLQRNSHLHQQRFKANYGNHYYGQPYWTQYYFNDEEASLKDCGGRDGDVDSEDSKVCRFSIQNATQKDSGNYTCWALNHMTCTEGTLNLDFRGKLPYIHIFRRLPLTRSLKGVGKLPCKSPIHRCSQSLLFS